MNEEKKQLEMCWIEVDLFNDVFFLKYRGETVGTVTAFVRDVCVHESRSQDVRISDVCPEYGEDPNLKLKG